MNRGDRSERAPRTLTSSMNRTPGRRHDTGRAGPGHPSARKTGPCTPPTHSITTGLPGAGGWLRSVSNVPDQPLPKSRRGWSGTTTTLHHPPKNKVKIKIKVKVKTISGAGAAGRSGYPGQWCRSSKPRGLNHRRSRRASPIRRVLRKTKRATLKGGPYWCANTIRAISARPRTSATPLP